MNDSDKYAHLGHEIPPLPEIARNGGWLPGGTPLTPETWYEFWCVIGIGLWFLTLTSSRHWAMLRRIPSKAYLLQLVDAYLIYAKSGRYYRGSPVSPAPVDMTERSALAERLRDLLADWEPPAVTPEIREAAMAVCIAESGSPPDENWDGPENDPPAIPLEAMLIWPEGSWDEEAFLAGKLTEMNESES